MEPKAYTDFTATSVYWCWQDDERDCEGSTREATPEDLRWVREVHR